jgi:hypothetical protein
MNERARRIALLTSPPRGMTLRAAETVVDAAMFGIGCLEGTVRARIELEKKDRHQGSALVAFENDTHSESSLGPLERR